MDLALWDAPHYEVSEENSYSFQNDWQYDFHFGQTLDVIEEEALNEKYCLQVLRILVAKADVEIIELEDDIVMLQAQLALANAEWSKRCFAALQDKIDSLEILIQSLKGVQNKHDPDVLSQLHREPAERIHVILKDLLCNSFQPKAEQPANTSGTSPSLLETIFSEKKHLDMYSLEERKTLDRREDYESQDEDASRNPFAKPQMKIRKNSDADSTSNAEKLRTEQLKERKLNNLTSGVSCTISPEEHGRPLSSNPGKKDDIVEKDNNDDSIIRETAKNVLAEASTKSSENGLRKFYSKSKQHTEKHSSTKEPGNRPNPPMIDENARHTIPLGKDTKAYISGDGTAFSGEKKWKNMGSEVSSLEEVRKQGSTDDRIISITLSDPVLKEKESADTVKVVGASDSTSNASKDIVKQSSLKQERRRELKAAEANHRDSRKKLVPTQKKKTIIDNRIKEEEQWLHETEPISTDSLLELLKYNRKDASRPLTKVKQKPQVRQVLNPEPHSTDVCSSNLPLKRKCPFLEEPCLADELGLKLAALGKFKRQLKPRILVKGSDVCSNNKNVKKENQQDLGEAKMTDAAPDGIMTSVPQQPKGRKIPANSLLIKANEEFRNYQRESANLHDNTGESTIEKGFRIGKYSFTDDSADEIPKTATCPTLSHFDLERAPLVALRAMAKEHSMKRYSKLQKAELLDLLGQRLKPPT